jgi:zinc protease
MLDEGAGDRGALEIAEEMDHLGADLSIQTYTEYSALTLQVLERNLDAALDLFGDMVARPTFASAEWSRVKQLWVNDLTQRREEPRDVSRVVACRAFYGEEHPYSHPSDGYESSVKAVELNDVRHFWRLHVRPDQAVLLVAGRLAPDELRVRLEKNFSRWSAGPPLPPSRQESLPAPGAHRLVLVDKPDAPQTEMRLLVPGPALSSPETACLVLQNIIFGGTFTSRLIANLRERHHFTYSASSRVSLRSFPGHIAAWSAVHTERTGAALIELLREFRAMERTVPTEEEIRKARSTHANRLSEALQTQAGTLGLYVRSAALGQSPREPREFHERVRRTGDREFAGPSRSRFSVERATVVLVGDQRKIETQIAALAADGGDDDLRSSLPALELRDSEGLLLRVPG